jgi:predicted amidophosphoribosyltransferase
VDLEVEEHPPQMLCGGWICAFGLYQPRWRMDRHRNSDWSQAVLMAKRRSENAVDAFGRVIARHLERMLMRDHKYVITHVPAEEEAQQYLFVDLGRCATETLAAAVYRHLQSQFAVTLTALLAQVRPKPHKQHQCRTDAERRENVRDIYALVDPSLVSGRSVILVDDVLTSGATMHECGRLLREAGAKSVMGIALAKTDRARAPVYGMEGTADWPGGDAA